MKRFPHLSIQFAQSSTMAAGTGKTVEVVDLLGNLAASCFPNTLVPQGQEMLIKKASLDLLVTTTKISSVALYAVEGEEAFTISTTEAEDVWDTGVLETAISGDNFFATLIGRGVTTTRDGSNCFLRRTFDVTKFLRRAAAVYTGSPLAESVNVDHKIAVAVRSDDTAVAVNLNGFITIWYDIRPLSWKPIN